MQSLTPWPFHAEPPPIPVFERAIREDRLSSNPHSDLYAGNFVYMGTMAGKDLFKNVDTREYLA